MQAIHYLFKTLSFFSFLLCRDNRKQTVAKEKALQDVKAAHSRLKSEIELLQRDRRSFMSKFQNIEGEIQRLKCRIQNLQQSAEVLMILEMLTIHPSV